MLVSVATPVAVVGFSSMQPAPVVLSCTESLVNHTMRLMTPYVSCAPLPPAVINMMSAYCESTVSNNWLGHTPDNVILCAYAPRQANNPPWVFRDDMNVGLGQNDIHVSTFDTTLKASQMPLHAFIRVGVGDSGIKQRISVTVSALCTDSSYTQLGIIDNGHNPYTRSVTRFKIPVSFIGVAGHTCIKVRGPDERGGL